MTPEYWDDEKTKPLHSCSGSFLHKNPIYYVTSYKNGRIRTSLNKKDAKHFTDDIECTKCMEQIVATKNPWTIAVWDYKGNECICECVHYPNEHWKDNNNLQPSLMYRSVSDFNKNGIDMLTKEEVLEKLYNSKETFIKILVKLGILKYKSHIQSKLDPRDVWVCFKFNYYNPLTYIYLISAIIIGTPIGLFNMSLKQVWRTGKEELTGVIEVFLD